MTPADFDYYTFVAPVDSRLPGGGGYPIPRMYDIKQQSFGQITSVTSQSSNFGSQSEVYNGFDFLVNARFPMGMVSGGLNVGRQIFNNCDVRMTRPNVTQAANTAAVFGVPLVGGVLPSNEWPLTEAYCDGDRPWDKQVKFQAIFNLRWGLRTSATYQNLPGIPIFATLTAGAAQVSAVSRSNSLLRGSYENRADRAIHAVRGPNHTARLANKPGFPSRHRAHRSDSGRI